jgi:hypothetical protein
LKSSFSEALLDLERFRFFFLGGGGDGHISSYNIVLIIILPVISSANVYAEIFVGIIVKHNNLFVLSIYPFKLAYNLGNDLMDNPSLILTRVSCTDLD